MTATKAAGHSGNAAPVEAQTDSRRKTEILISRLGAMRDGLLLLAGLIYLLGYISWASYALDKGIGMVPVLDAQYFAAGIVPALILLLFIWSVRLLRAFQRWLKRPVSQRYVTLQTILIYVALAVLLLFGCLKLILRKSAPEWISWYPFAVGVIFISAAFVGRARGDRLVQVMGLFLIWSYTALGTFWLILGYNFEVFPRLPSELGGPKARCAKLDVDSTHISSETRLRLHGDSAGPSDQNVFRSEPVYVIFDGSEYLVLAEHSGPLSATNRAYRVGKAAVKAMFPCAAEESGPHN